MNKVIMVSGGNAGLGLGISQRLQALGNTVVAFGLPEHQQQEFTGFVEDQINFVAANLTNEAQITELCEQTAAYFGRIDAIVNNAALGPLGTLENTSVETWQAIQNVNLLGPFIFAKAVLPHMRSQGGGNVINIGSGAGWGKANMLAYATSKGGLIAFNQALALDLFQYKIRVNALIPGGGGIVTPMALERFQGRQEALQAKAVGSVAGRPIHGGDMADAIEFLVSDAAQTISGTVIDVGCFHHQGSSTPLGIAK
ncbi:SDR family NAD(P)-dependent oxidoreductase [Acinetobacter baumannii]|uniref:SDR family NAD(P)-dependent oxidoreductase n=1 Tax=Acinetobacter baumannii TaxID=470 RepID=UPI00233FF4CC|nr:SDR family oxidoreductase [Acinetobacter baumannii]